MKKNSIESLMQVLSAVGSFDSIAQDHDGAYLPGSLPLSGFGVDGKNYGARINALD